MKRGKDGNPPLEWLKNTALLWNSDDCLIWPFGVDRDGYGRVKENGYETRAHRMIFKIAYGRWPSPCALHSCDIPQCCNLRHLSEGTIAENARQMAKRGRSLRGVLQHSAKLTEVDVRRIRIAYKRRKYGDVQRLSSTFSVSRRIIRLVATRKLWSHVQ